MSSTSEMKINTYPNSKCFLCNTEGTILYEELEDRLFGAPGKWNLKKCLNKECGLVWLDPMPAADDIWKAYRTYYTHQTTNYQPKTMLRRLYQFMLKVYLAKKFDYQHNSSISVWEKVISMLMFLHPGLRAKADFSVMYLKSRNNGKLLDVGCGNGSFMKNMRNLGWDVEGVDFDLNAVETAKSKGLSVRQGTLEEQEYPNNHFDAITMCHLIEHVHDPVPLLQECYRILKPGGELVIVTPNNESWGHKRFQQNWRGLEPPRHLHIFNLQTLHLLSSKTGFTKVEVRTSIRDAGGLQLASRWLEMHGSFTMGSKFSRKSLLCARIIQLAEWALLKISPNVGEEVVLVAKK